MPSALRRVAVLTHAVGDHTGSALRELAAVRGQLGEQLLLPPDEVATHPTALDLGYAAIAEEELRAADVCLVFGGDGTILRALDRLLGTRVPTIGVNFGNVGFLASLPQEGWGPGLAEVVGGRYTIVELLTVEARLGGERFVGVNDVVLSRIEPRGVLLLDYAISGTPIGEMRCDGMIIASPAGSTAYNLSCDGPIVVWDASALVLNFVAPHSLGFRPMVLRPDHVISVCNRSELYEAEVIVDGKVVGRLAREGFIEIGASPLRARLLQLEGGSFYRNVEQKLFGGPAPADAG